LEKWGLTGRFDAETIRSSRNRLFSAEVRPTALGEPIRLRNKEDGTVVVTISYAEMAERLGVSVKTVRKAVRDGQFPSVMVGKRRKPLRKPFEEILRLREGETTDGRLIPRS
jgi:excisionase family DNA binding protein